MRQPSNPVSLIVTGMHRSGTSLAASLIASMGVAMGEEMLAADGGNPRGYFEDLAFLDLDRRMLNAASRVADGGHPDWGWTESERLDETPYAAFRAEAERLVAARIAAGRPWGFKDPRASLLLDFWDALLPDGGYLLLYRPPWEVADSMQRLGAATFLRHPDYAYRIWHFYNRRLLAFRRQIGDRALLMSAYALGKAPERLAELLRVRFGIVSAAAPPALYEPELLHSLPANDPLVRLAAATHAECGDLLAELDAAADLSGAYTRQRRPLRAPQTVATPVVSVIIPCFDHGEFLIEAVASVERAVEPPYELIVINDGSTEPSTLAILETLRAAGYDVRDQPQSGLATARNRGAATAKADLVLPLDADNRLREGFVREALQVLREAPDVGAVYGDRWEFGLRSGRVQVGVFDLARLLCGNYIDACAVIRRRVLAECGGYDARMPVAGSEDWDLWLSAVERDWKLRRLDRVAFDYRVRPQSMLRSLDDPEAYAAVERYVLNKHHRLYFSELRQLVLNLREALGRAPGGGPPESEVTLSRRVDELTEQIARQAQDLDAWRARVAFMGDTKAWRLRQWIVAWRNRLRSGVSRS